MPFVSIFNIVLQILFYMTLTVQNRSWRSNFLDLHVSFSMLFTSSTPVCLSGLLQLYSFSRSLHPSGGTCPQPLPSCMCTGGVVRSIHQSLGPASVWAHRHSTAVMYHLSASFFLSFLNQTSIKTFFLTLNLWLICEWLCVWLCVCVWGGGGGCCVCV